ncbi:conserved Plasmodium protein, unknown function [Plasmodium reichenowi]|uniref:Secreted ookinete protein 25 n=1 Tax=Plasmodium reichenowi TaxID=5854 RepID=A0A060RPY1_PLARE|nr:conserved Plasmodium protein, unknown function [Plasmodium reichenowi]
MQKRIYVSLFFLVFFLSKTSVVLSKDDGQLHGKDSDSMNKYNYIYRPNADNGIHNNLRPSSYIDMEHIAKGRDNTSGLRENELFDIQNDENSNMVPDDEKVITLSDKIYSDKIKRIIEYRKWRAQSKYRSPAKIPEEDMFVEGYKPIKRRDDNLLPYEKDEKDFEETIQKYVDLENKLQKQKELEEAERRKKEIEDEERRRKDIEEENRKKKELEDAKRKKKDMEYQEMMKKYIEEEEKMKKKLDEEQSYKKLENLELENMNTKINNDDMYDVENGFNDDNKLYTKINKIVSQVSQNNELYVNIMKYITLVYTSHVDIKQDNFTNGSISIFLTFENPKMGNDLANINISFFASEQTTSTNEVAEARSNYLTNYNMNALLEDNASGRLLSQDEYIKELVRYSHSINSSNKENLNNENYDVNMNISKILQYIIDNDINLVDNFITFNRTNEEEVTISKLDDFLHECSKVNPGDINKDEIQKIIKTINKKEQIIKEVKNSLIKKDIEKCKLYTTILMFGSSIYSSIKYFFLLMLFVIYIL